MLWELALSMRSTGGPDSNYPQNVLLQQPSSQAAKQPSSRRLAGSATVEPRQRRTEVLGQFRQDFVDPGAPRIAVRGDRPPAR